MRRRTFSRVRSPLASITAYSACGDDRRRGDRALRFLDPGSRRRPGPAAASAATGEGRVAPTPPDGKKKRVACRPPFQCAPVRLCGPGVRFALSDIRWTGPLRPPPPGGYLRTTQNGAAARPRFCRCSLRPHSRHEQPSKAAVRACQRKPRGARNRAQGCSLGEAAAAM
jgi:hypothetical protein